MMDYLKTIRRIAAISLSSLVVASTVAYSQATDLEVVLREFKNYRYGNVSIYHVEPPTATALKKSLQTTAEVKEGVSDEACKKCSEEAVKALERVLQRTSYNKPQALKRLEESGVTVTTDLDKCAEYKIANRQTGGAKIEDLYVVTTRAEKGVTPTIIAMIASYKQKGNLEDHLRTASLDNIFTYDELKQRKPAPDLNVGATDLYELTKVAFVQGAVKNVTAEAQGIGTIGVFADKMFGLAEPLVRKESDISAEDIQTYMRISEGQPQLYRYPNEIIASYDLLSYRKYRPGYLTAAEAAEEMADTTKALEDKTIFNNFLPLYGVELRYGMEEMNYPSLWSERLALNAMWENVKAGVILPVGAYASMGPVRKLTHAGFGVNGAFDFPIKIIPKSGVFHADFGYVSGNAVEGAFNERPKEDTVTSDYLLRMNAQLHYTFGIKVDREHLFRFRIGGSLYSMEYWANRTQYDAKTKVTTMALTKTETKTIGGVSGRIEYMATNVATPYGVGLQYFDEAIGGDIWLQVPVSSTLALRLDAKAFITAFRDIEEHPWENSSVFFPTIRVIWNF